MKPCSQEIYDNCSRALSGFSGCKVWIPTESVPCRFKQLHSLRQIDECTSTKEAIPWNIERPRLPRDPFQVDRSSKAVVPPTNLSHIAIIIQFHSVAIFLVFEYHRFFLFSNSVLLDDSQLLKYINVFNFRSELLKHCLIVEVDESVLCAREVSSVSIQNTKICM